MQAPYFFISPMLAQNQAWAAFRLDSTAAGRDDVNVYRDTLPRFEALARLFPPVIGCAPEWLADSEFIKKLGRNQAILVVPESVASRAEDQELCKRAQQAGLQVGLRVADAATLKKISTAAFSHLLMDARVARSDIPLIDLINAHQLGFHLVADGVANYELFDWAAAKRFSALRRLTTVKRDD